jgi:hypothetical protein
MWEIILALIDPSDLHMAHASLHLELFSVRLGGEAADLVERLASVSRDPETLWTVQLDDGRSNPQIRKEATAAVTIRLEYVAPRGSETIREPAESMANAFSENGAVNS